MNSKKYGVDLIHFAHANKDAIHSSTKIDNTIRYLSLHDNKYLRYFLGHTKKVVSLCMSPLDDMFLSGSLDKTIRLWDLRTNNCQVKICFFFNILIIFFIKGFNAIAIEAYCSI